MLKRFLAVCASLALLAAPARAQIAVPNTLVSGTTIRASDLNTNFSTLGNHALDRLSGGNLSGNITADNGVTIDGLDISAQLCPTCSAVFNSADVVVGFRHSGDLATTLSFPANAQIALNITGTQDFLLTSSGLTLFNNALVNSTGKIPALTSAYFTSVDGSTLTNLSGANVTSGINGSNVTTGTVVAARLPADVAYTDAANSFTLTNTFAALSVTGASTLTGTVTASTGLTVSAGGANITGVITGSSTIQTTGNIQSSAGVISSNTFSALGGTNNTGFADVGFSMGTWGTTASAANAHVANGDVVRLVTSLRAAKHDIQPISIADAKNTVLGLTAVLYESAIDEDQRQWAGFIADDVEKVNPVLAVYTPQGKLQSVTYDRIPAYLLPVVQDHERQIEALKAEVASLERALAIKP